MSFRTPIANTNFSADLSAGFSPLLSLVYVSASSHLMSDDELEAILRTSRENNSEVGLTGMLLYYDGAFMQVLEGREETVRQTYARINQDPRHHTIIPLLQEYIPQRNFADWSMAYHRLQRDDMAQVEGFTRLAEADAFLDYFRQTPQRSLTLLKTFRKQYRG